MNRLALGRRLRKARTEQGYTQQALAKKADLAEVYLGEIERGQKIPSMSSFVRLIEALGVSADSVLREDLTSGQHYVYDELTQKLRGLTPKQRQTAADILDAYIKNLR